MRNDVVMRARDGWFVKDGRGWYTAGAGRAYGHLWPPPSTVLGALRGVYGRQQEKVGGRALRPEDWLALAPQVQLEFALPLRAGLGSTPSAADRLWPRPLDALYQENVDTVTPLRPVRPTIATMGCDDGRADSAAREALWWPRVTDPNKPERLRAWWTEDEFSAWLRDAQVAKPERAGAGVEPYEPVERIDVHVTINPATLTAADGQLFSHPVRETVGWGDGWQHEFVLAARFEAPDDAVYNGAVATLGGKRRLARLEPPGADWVDPPAGLVDALVDKRHLRVFVVTPAEFDQGWLPDGLGAAGAEYRGDLGLPGLRDVTLRAAFVGRALGISGWDMAAGKPGAGGAPKATRRLVPAGSVYFLELAEALTAEQARGLWLAAWGGSQDEGYGRVVPGVWNPAEGVGND